MYLIASFCWMLVYIDLTSADFVSTSTQSYFVSEEAVNWTNAKRACVEAGYELASVLTLREKERLDNFLEDNRLTPKDAYSGYWLAGVRHANGSFYWDEVNVLMDRDLEAWSYGEPSNGESNENCIELKYDYVKLGWNDLVCTDLRRYLCQKK